MGLPRASVGTMIRLLALMTAGCGSQSVNSSPISPTAPTAIAPVPSGPTVTLTGRVTDASGVGLNASVAASPLRWSILWSGQPRAVLRLTLQDSIDLPHSPSILTLSMCVPGKKAMSSSARQQ
jgi:hypothetical protein